LFELCAPDAIDEQLRVCEEILQQGSGLSWTAGTDAHFARYHAYLQRADPAGAERSLAAFARFASRHRLRIWSWHCERLHAQHLLDIGQLAEAELRFEALAHEADRLRVPLGRTHLHSQRIALNLARTGKHFSAQTLEPPEATPALAAITGFRVLRAQHALDVGDIEVARELFRALADHDFETVTNDVFSLCSLVGLTTLAVGLNEREAALSLQRLLEPHAELIALSPFTLSSGCVARHVGALAVFLEQRPAARTHFELAIAISTRMGHELDRARSMLALGQWFAQGERQADRNRALQLSAQVSRWAQGVGATALATAARELESRVAVERAERAKTPAKQAARGARGKAAQRRG
jgi:hypothetical protein